jgi:transposase-like protein
MKTIDVVKQFATETACLDYLEKSRWPNGVCCIECGSTKVERLNLNARPSGKALSGSKHRAEQRAASRRVYQCLEPECLHQFTATAGTIFHKTHLPINTWFMAIAMMGEAKKGMSANQMKRHLGINYRTAWFLNHRIRQSMQETGLLEGLVEVDETFLTPKKPRKGHPRVKNPNRDVVVGMIERGGKLRLVPVHDAKMAIIEPVIEKHVSPNATFQTDESAVYAIIGNRRFAGRHRTINHRRTYGVGENHTNSIENAFSLLKKGIYGTFHKVSIKHLGRYCNEFSYRFNRRGQQEQIFAETVKNLLRTEKLPYKKLIAGAEAN